MRTIVAVCILVLVTIIVTGKLSDSTIETKCDQQCWQKLMCTQPKYQTLSACNTQTDQGEPT